VNKMKKQSTKKNTKQYTLAKVVSVVSHQLSTPLSAIKGYLEVLLSGDLGDFSPQQKEYLDVVFKNTIDMVRLVGELLDITRIESNQMEFKPEPKDITEIVKATIKELSLLARAKNCELSFKIIDEPPILNIDPVKTKQAIANIIFNAILYKRGKGKVWVSLSKKGEEVVFCCEDTGIGIAEKEKDKIFTKFYRSERAFNISAKGLGLGLFISKAIIEGQGGRIWFESKEDEGSMFSFSLPIKS